MIYPQIFTLHSLPATLDREVALRCVDECLDCISSCTACADDCLAEPDLLDLVRCVRLDLDCADICDATVRVLSRQTMPDLRVIRNTVEACAVACSACADECERHATNHQHCRLCAQMCRQCEQACDDLLAAIGA
jgi:hypothetical protein